MVLALNTLVRELGREETKDPWFTGCQLPWSSYSTAVIITCLGRGKRAFISDNEQYSAIIVHSNVI